MNVWERLWMGERKGSQIRLRNMASKLNTGTTVRQLSTSNLNLCGVVCTLIVRIRHHICYLGFTMLTIHQITHCVLWVIWIGR